MTLDQVFTELAPSIVALGSRFITQPLAEGPDIPAIVGTGFVVDSSGSPDMWQEPWQRRAMPRWGPPSMRNALPSP